MSLYLSDWYNGPVQFIDFGEFAWDPAIKLKFNKDKPWAVSSFVTAFNMDELGEFVGILGEDLGKRFIERFDNASDVIFELLQTQKFIEANVNIIYKFTGKNIDTTSEIITELFNKYILDFEFWHHIDLLEVYTNLIFYGVAYDVKPLFFVVPPMSEWNAAGDSWIDED